MYYYVDTSRTAADANRVITFTGCQRSVRRFTILKRLVHRLLTGPTAADRCILLRLQRLSSAPHHELGLNLATNRRIIISWHKRCFLITLLSAMNRVFTFATNSKSTAATARNERKLLGFLWSKVKTRTKINANESRLFTWAMSVVKQYYVGFISKALWQNILLVMALILARAVI